MSLFASFPGWLQIIVILATAGVIALIAGLAGVPLAYTPLVLGGALGLMTALVAGAPGRDED